MFIVFTRKNPVPMRMAPKLRSDGRLKKDFNAAVLVEGARRIGTIPPNVMGRPGPDFCAGPTWAISGRGDSGVALRSSLRAGGAIFSPGETVPLWCWGFPA